MSDSKKLILKGFVYTSLGLILSKLFTYLWRIIAARIGAEDYGMLSIVLAIMTFVLPISALGLSAAVERYVSFFVGAKDKTGVKSTIVNSLKYSISFSIIIAVVLYLSSDMLAGMIFHSPEMAPLLKVFSIFLPLLVLDSVLTPLFRVFDRLDYFTFVKYFLEGLLKVILAIFFISLGYGIFGVAFAYVISIGISAILLFIFSRKYCFDFMDSKIKVRSNIKELLNYSLPLVIGGLAAFVLSATDTLMIGYFKDSIQVGIYNAAYPTANLLLIIPTGMLVVFLPIITKNLAQKRFDEINKAYRFVTKWIFVFDFFIFLVMFTYSDKLIGLLFGAEYLPGGAVLKLLAIGLFLNSLMGMSAISVLQMFKKSRLIMKIIIFGAVLNVIMNYYLIPSYGIMGGAIATLLSTITNVALFQYFAFKASKITPISKDMVVSGIFNIILFYGIIKLFSGVFGQISTSGTIILIPIIFIFYLVSLYLFKIIRISEFKIFIDYIKTKT